MFLLKSFLERRSCRFQWIYIFTAIFLFLVGMTGIMYGSALVYWPLALVCLTLLFYPTLFAWGIIALVYISGSGIYIFAMIRDIIVPRKAGIYSDGIFGPLFAFVIIVITFFVVMSFPKKKEKNPNKPFNKIG